jgi:hypothetical protein
VSQAENKVRGVSSSVRILKKDKKYEKYDDDDAAAAEEAPVCEAESEALGDCFVSNDLSAEDETTCEACLEQAILSNFEMGSCSNILWSLSRDISDCPCPDDICNAEIDTYVQCELEKERLEEGLDGCFDETITEDAALGEETPVVENAEMAETDPPEEEEEETDPPEEEEEETDPPEEEEEETDPPEEEEEETDAPETDPPETDPPEPAQEDEEPVDGEDETEPEEPADGEEETGPPVEGTVEAPTDTEAPVSEGEEVEETPAPTELAPDSLFTVPLSPFAISLEGALLENEDFDLEVYLLTHMQKTLTNLINITLEAEPYMPVVEEPKDEPVTLPEMANATTSNSTNMRRLLRAAVVHRKLQEYTLSFTGSATFMGPPMRTQEEVDVALATALQDTDALMVYLEESPAFTGNNITFEGVEVETEKPTEKPMEETNETSTTETGIQGIEAEEKSDDDGLSTTGLTIVIVAACVGGLSILIIAFVGMFTGGAEPAPGGPKGALPEQPLR